MVGASSFEMKLHTSRVFIQNEIIRILCFPPKCNCSAAKGKVGPVFLKECCIEEGGILFVTVILFAVLLHAVVSL